MDTSRPMSFVLQQQRLYSDADIEKLIDGRIASRGLQPHVAQAQPTRIDLQAQPTQTDLQDAIKMLVDAMKSSRRTLAKKPSPARKKADDIRVDRFLRDQLKNMTLDDIDNNYGHDYDPVDEMRQQIEEDDAIEGIRHQLDNFHINQAKIINAVKKLAKSFISVDTIRKIIQSEIGVALQEEINKILSSLPTYTTQTRPSGLFH
ncbi:unnamed protein product [Rhizophagus irregularis]|nr:unnamed protein product [Rhizophagus irregularis]CAB5373364.1 unnamed protein product [Rhizophagus irregularis]